MESSANVSASQPEGQKVVILTEKGVLRGEGGLEPKQVRQGPGECFHADQIFLGHFKK